MNRASAAGPLVVALDEKSPTLQPKFLPGFRALVPGAKLLVLGEATPLEEACEALRGVEGFVLYSNAAKDLVPALRQLANAHLWLPRSVLEYFAQQAAKATSKSRSEVLTPREAQVLALLTERLSNREIAERMGVAERTVKFHVGHLFDKLGVHDRRSAAEVADSWQHFEVDARAA